MSRRSTPPKYAKHSSGQARVRMNGRVIYMGPYGSPESRDRYGRLAVLEQICDSSHGWMQCELIVEAV